jgi:hypothetical protein
MWRMMWRVLWRPDLSAAGEPSLGEPRNVGDDGEGADEVRAVGPGEPCSPRHVMPLSSTRAG